MSSPPRKVSKVGQASFTATSRVRRFDDARYVPPAEELVAEMRHTDCVMIDAACGLGKSTCIRGYLEHVVKTEPDARILMLSVRVIHATNILADFTTRVLRPVSYLNGKVKDLLDHSFVILSWEQANRLAFKLQSGNQSPFTHVILDEIRSGLEKVEYDSTVKDMTCFECVWEVAKRARKLILADADCRFDEVVPTFLRTLQIKYVTWHVPYRRLKRKLLVEFYTKRDRATHIMASFRKAVDELAGGEKLLVVSSTQKTAKAYALYCRDLGIPFVVYHGSSGTNKQDFEDPDWAWESVQAVIYNTCVTVGVDPKRTTFKEIFLHTSFYGANWLSMFQAVSRGNRHCEDQMFTIHTLLTCKHPGQAALSRLVNGVQANDPDGTAPNLNRCRAAISGSQECRTRFMAMALQEAHQAMVTSELPGLSEIRALVKLTSERHRSAVTHFSEFCKCAEHQGWPIEFVETSAPSVALSMIEFSSLTNEAELEEACRLGYGPKIVSQMLATQLYELEVDDREALGSEIMMKAETIYKPSNKGTKDYIESHHRDAFHQAQCGLWMKLRHLDSTLFTHVDKIPDPQNSEAEICVLKHWDEVDKYSTEAHRLAVGIFADRTPLRMNAAKGIVEEKERVDAKGHFTSDLYTFESLCIFCRNMGIQREDLLSGDEFTAPGHIIELLNKEHRGMALFGRDFDLRCIFVETARLLGDTPDYLWKAIQKIARHFGYRIKKAECTIDGKKHCFASVAFKLQFSTDFLNMQKLYCFRTFKQICVTQWANHRERLDYESVELRFLDEMNAILSMVPGSPESPPSQAPTRTFRETVDLEQFELCLGRLETQVSRMKKPRLDSTKPSRGASRERRKEYAVKLKMWRREMAEYNDVNEKLKILQTMKEHGERNDAECTLSFEVAYKCLYAVGRDVVVDSKRSLQLCPKKLRGPLGASIYHDLDMENCHYMIMVQIAESHGVQLAGVHRYVDNRAKYLQDVRSFYDVSRSAAKQLFLSLLNGGGPGKWMHDFDVDKGLAKDLAHGRTLHPDIVRTLQREYLTIREVMFGKYEDHVETLVTALKRDKPQEPEYFDREQHRLIAAETDEYFEERVKRSAFSHFLQNEEKRCLNATIEKLSELEYEVGCKIFDGCLVRRKVDPDLPRSVIEQCESHILAKTGYKMRLWEKCLMCGEKLADCGCNVSDGSDVY